MTPLEQERIRRLRPLGRASLALPDVQAADAVSRAWGEAVWTEPILWRLACLDAAVRLSIPRWL